MTTPPALALLWQIPLSLVSWATHRTLKGIMLAETSRRWRREPAARTWRGLSEHIRQPAPFWFVMIVGPRWNCHAFLADLGPVHVRRSIDIRPGAPLRAGQHLSFVIYDASYRNAGHRDWTRSEAPPDPGIRLEPGVYRVSARLYGFTPGDLYPEVQVDGSLQAAATPIGAEQDRYHSELRRLPDRCSPAFCFIHYYMFHALCWRRVLGEPLTERLFVPVGNPATRFYFGIIRRGQRLTVTSDEAENDGRLSFVAIYNRCSVPVFWATLATPVYQTPVMAVTGYFLLRTLVTRRNLPAASLQWQCDWGS